MTKDLEKVWNTAPIVIDCDPGADDALGLFLLMSRPETRTRLRGITTVFGNGPLSTSTQNVARILGFADLHLPGMERKEKVPVCPGAERPLKKNYTPSPLYCGKDGLCETGLAEHPEYVSELTATRFYQDLFSHTKEKIILLCTAGFTNLASLLQTVPDAKEHILCVVAASGYFGLTRREVRAEWNIVLDPDAAKIVYTSGIPILASGLDVTSGLADQDAEHLKHRLAGTPTGDFVEKVLAYDSAKGLYLKSILADGMAAALLLDPHLGTGVTGNAVVHEDREDASMIEFIEEETGSIEALCEYNIPAYLELLGDGLEQYR
ncbi:MAG: nucleoside hydrolase [Lachnospiraceae bacterium]